MHLSNPLMHTVKILKLLLTYHLSIFVTTVTLYIAGAIALNYMDTGFQPFIIWFKILTLGIGGYFISSYKRKEFYYYQNLGMPKMFLWICKFSFDLTLFLALLFLMS